MNVRVLDIAPEPSSLLETGVRAGRILAGIGVVVLVASLVASRFVGSRVGSIASLVVAGVIGVGLPLLGVALSGGDRARLRTKIRFTATDADVEIVWHRGEQVLRHERFVRADIVGIALEQQAGEAPEFSLGRLLRRGRGDEALYRLVLLTSRGAIELAAGYQPGREDYVARRKQILELMEPGKRVTDV